MNLKSPKRCDFQPFCILSSPTFFYRLFCFRAPRHSVAANFRERRHQDCEHPAITVVRSPIAWTSSDFSLNGVASPAGGTARRLTFPGTCFSCVYKTFPGPAGAPCPAPSSSDGTDGIQEGDRAFQIRHGPTECLDAKLGGRRHICKASTSICQVYQIANLNCKTIRGIFSSLFYKFINAKSICKALGDALSL